MAKIRVRFTDREALEAELAGAIKQIEILQKWKDDAEEVLFATGKKVGERDNEIAKLKAQLEEERRYFKKAADELRRLKGGR